MNRANRSKVAAFLTLIYLLIIASPLAPLALNSPFVAHALTGECAGDCSVCGCDPVRSATRTCCCWQKKMHEHHEKQPAKASACCPKKSATTTPVAKCSALPCGSKHIVIGSAESFEYLLYIHNGSLPVHYEVPTVLSPDRSLVGRVVEPPDPPPKITVCS